MGADRTGEPQANQRLTVAQAAARLGITEGAVRSRIKRGTLPTTKEGGAVVVLLGGGTSQANQPTNTDVPDDQFVAQLLDRVASLERQLERREDETERLHQIIGRLTQTNAEQARTIGAIEAPTTQEPAEDAEAVEEEPEGTSPRSATGIAQTATQRPQGGTLRGWRQRILGW